MAPSDRNLTNEEALSSPVRDTDCRPYSAYRGCACPAIKTMKSSQLIDPGMNNNNAVFDAQGNCVIRNDALKLELIGKSFESVHRCTADIEITRFFEIVD